MKNCVYPSFKYERRILRNDPTDTDTMGKKDCKICMIRFNTKQELVDHTVSERDHCGFGENVCDCDGCNPSMSEYSPDVSALCSPDIWPDLTEEKKRTRGEDSYTPRPDP